MKLCLKVLTKLIHIVLFQKQASGLQTLWLACSCMEAPVWVFPKAGNKSDAAAKHNNNVEVHQKSHCPGS